ncbi:MAG: hypothetical protein RI562_06325, partial [Salibacter sp.]|uniref:hypothetical protein n=1 Tax=Salibacter sp. TaxID=2010995 RepID=UPI00286FD8FA
MIQRIIMIIILTLTTAVSHSQQLQLFTNVQGISQVYDLAFDNESNVYAAGLANGNAAVVKLDSNGNEIWRNDIIVEGMNNRIAIAQEVFVNDSGQVFVSCSREVGDGAVARLDNTNGNIIWKRDDLNTYNSSNSQVGKYSKMLYANNGLILTVESDISDDDYLYFQFNPTNGDKLNSKIIQKPLRVGHTGFRKRDKIYNHMFIGHYPNYSQNQIEIIGGEADSLIFDSINISNPTYFINLIGLHNNKFYGIRNDDLGNNTYSPTLVHIDSVTGDIIY